MAPVGFRRCLICRQLAHRDQLERIVRDVLSGQVQLNQGMGRSVYICRQESCLKEALRKNRLGKSLRAPIPSAVITELQQRFICRRIILPDK